MKTFQLLTIKVIVFFNFFYPVYSSPNSFREVKYYRNPNDLKIHNLKIDNVGLKRNFKISNNQMKNTYIKKLLKNNLDLKVLKRNSLKNKLTSNFKDKFKDLSSTYVSPFGKPINRAPDESLINCQSKECYE